jgi:aspartate/methionine/tyrosine aminotransferase
MNERRIVKSEYMYWAKTAPHARYNLASSDLLHVTLRELHVRGAHLEITGEDGYGHAPLREAIASRYSVEPGSVVTTAGASMANHLALAALIKPGDEVLVEEPTYELIPETAAFLGARVRRFPRRFEEDFRIDPGEVRKRITPRTRLIVLTNLHNPSSAFTSGETLRALGAIARRARARVLVDEAYLDTAFSLRPRSASHIGGEFVSTSSLTKAYGLSGLRCGWILAEPRIASRMWRLADLFYSSLPHIAHQLSVIAFRNLPVYARRARGLLDANTEIVNRFFGSRDDLEAMAHKHGLVAFPLVKGRSVDKLCRILLERYETLVVPGKYFGMPGHIRISIGGSTANVRRGLARLGKALDGMKNR